MTLASDRKGPNLAGKLRASALVAGLALFAASLASPGVVYKADTRSNPKASDCGFAVRDGVMCESFSFGGGGMTTCELVNGSASGRTFVDKQKILDYCKGWDAPIAAQDFGYHILLMGPLGVFLGVFAWFANPLILLALLLSNFRKRLISMIFAVAAVALGLQAYGFRAAPFNESSMDPSNLNYVDHLGYGFYLWMAALVLFAASCFATRRSPYLPSRP